MALKKASTAQVVDPYQITEVPDAIPRDRWDRPLVVPKAGGQAVAYTRASTLGKAIDDTYHLNLWTIRTVIYGMSRRTDLVAAASAVETNEGDDRKKLDEIGERAKEAGKGNVGADVGTALHKLSERADKGEDLSWLAPELRDAIFAYLEQMKIFKVLASEHFVACDEVMSAGSFDRVVELLVDLVFNQDRDGKIVEVTIPAGTILVVDLKTGKLSSAKYWGPTYGVQQTVYACGEPYTPRGRITWEELLGDGNRPSTDWALILHVPGDSPRDAGLMVVDLEDGRALADLAVAIRNARKVKSLLTEAYPVEPVIVQDVITPDDARAIEARPSLDENLVDLFLMISRATDEDVLTALYEASESLWGDEHTEAVKRRLAELAAPAEKPVQVRSLELMAALKAAPDEAAMSALWQAHQDVWGASHSAMARQKAKEFGAAVAG